MEKEKLTTAKIYKHKSKACNLQVAEYDSYLQYRKDCLKFVEHEGVKLQDKAKFYKGLIDHKIQIDAFEKGYCEPERVSSVRRKAKSIKFEKTKGVTQKRRKLFNSYDGEIDIDRLSSGNTKFFQKKTKSKKMSRVNTYYVDFGITANYSTDEYENGVQEILTYIISDLQKGVNVEIYGILINEGCYPEKTVLMFPVKKANERISLDRFVAISYTSFFRFYGFAALRNAYNRMDYRHTLGRNNKVENTKKFIRELKSDTGGYFSLQYKKIIEFNKDEATIKPLKGLNH